MNNAEVQYLKEAQASRVPICCRGFFEERDLAALEVWAATLTYRPVPAWLGNFSFRLFGEAYGKTHGLLPQDIRELVDRMMGVVPDQKFTTVFVQRYREGELVRPHRDPRDNVGYTLIAVLGDFEGAETKIYGDDDDGSTKIQLRRGDLFRLPCTIGGVQGPKHEVSAVTRGTRYALILNTIETRQSGLFST